MCWTNITRSVRIYDHPLTQVVRPAFSSLVIACNMRMRFGSTRAAALQLHALPQPTSRLPHDGGKAALCALWCSALLLTGRPAAQASVLDDAFTAAADASFPIITAMRPDAMDRLTKIAAQASPAELGKAVELGIDAALSVPSDSAGMAATGLSAAFSGVSPATCQLFPLPAAGSFDRALVGVDPAKLQAARLALGKLPGREGGVCIPPRERLAPLVLSQREALKTADPAKLAAFQAQAQLALKTVPTGARLGELGALQAQVGELPASRVRYTSPRSPLYLPYLSPMAQVGELPERRRLKAALAEVDAPTISPLYLPYISTISRLWRRWTRRARRRRRGGRPRCRRPSASPSAARATRWTWAPSASSGRTATPSNPNPRP